MRSSPARTTQFALDTTSTRCGRQPASLSAVRRWFPPASRAYEIAKDKNPSPESEFSAEDPAAINASRHWLERPETPSHATSMVADPPNGRLPALTPAGQQRQAERRAARTRGLPASYKDFTNYNRCLTRGATGSILPVIYGNGTQIVQAPGYVVIRNEMIHEARVIPLDNSPRPGPNVRLWLGVSRGHFEGDTLVIETTNFSDRTGLGGNGTGPGHSDQLKLTERLKRIDEKRALRVHGRRRSHVHTAVECGVRPRREAGLRDL